MNDELVEEVRQRYAEAATAVQNNTSSETLDCCSDDCCGGSNLIFGKGLYEQLERDALPDAALMASLGCGNPTAVADLSHGETVLDLGSGGGIDVLLSARRVGPTGKAIGLDMTDEMLELAEKNKRDAGLDNVEFLKGHIEDIPLPDHSVDVVISNCVINLSTDKRQVFSEISRVLKQGGRIGISDVVSSNELTSDQRSERGSYVGCIAGALSFEEYEHGLRSAGFSEISISPSHEVGHGMFAAIIKARAGSSS